MYKKIIILIFSILLINLVYANLEISPNPIDVTIKINEPKTFKLTLHNNYSFEIMDFKFENLTDLGFSFSDISLSPNDTKELSFTVEREESYFGSIDSEVSFNYYVDLPEEITTFYVNITPQGFEPDYLTIREGDTVMWKNIDDISHSVTSSLFDYSLEVNQSISHTFNMIQTVNYQDLVLFYPGIIDVINRTSQQKAHNPNYDKLLTVNLNAILNPTELIVENLEDTFEVSATGSTEGMLKIKNNGTEIAELVSLTSDSEWIIFNENNFSVSIDETRYVKYTIDPIILNSNQTNMSYIISLKTRASNTQIYENLINVFVPYSDVFEDFTSSDEAFMIWFSNIFCPQHPDLFICNTSRKEGEGEKIIYKDPEIPVNLTATEVYTMLKRIQRIEDSNQRTDNKVKQLADEWGITIPQMYELMNKSLELQKENEDKQKTRSSVNWIIWMGVVISVSILLVFWFIRRYNYKKRIAEGEYRFKT